MYVCILCVSLYLLNTEASLGKILPGICFCYFREIIIADPEVTEEMIDKHGSIVRYKRDREESYVLEWSIIF